MNFKENENKGFSLVELIVVIAIMAVMTSVLAPTLIGYVEKSRMQKDDSAMGEITNAIKLALVDQDVYDECLVYNVKENYSCYVDATPDNTVEKIIDQCYNGVDHTASGSEDPCTSSGTQKADAWHYGDETRLKDETAFLPSGSMRGMTLTFVPEPSANSTKFTISQARVNEVKSGNKKGTDGTQNGLTMGDMKTGAAGMDNRLYNKLRAVVGDSITLTSQTYRYSEYTVFIRMGSTGGNQVSVTDAVAVYGQWNGTNLTAADYNAGGAGGAGDGT